jgi:alanyl-tRNA synthetase
MFYWVADSEPPSGAYSVDDWIRDDDAKNWLEIWNDVFIQFEWQGSLRNPTRPGDGYVKEAMPELPFRSIDTGMGLERTAVVLGGYASIYDTDAFAAIFATIDSLTPATGGNNITRARRIIADHIRTSCFCIADGVLPGNTGRGYVLRRLIRRAVLKGQRVLGFDDLFLWKVADAVITEFGGHYSELVEQRAIIEQTLKQEEVLFRRTLKTGEALLVEWMSEDLRAGCELLVKYESEHSYRRLDRWLTVELDGNRYDLSSPSEVQRLRADSKKLRDELSQFGRIGTIGYDNATSHERLRGIGAFRLYDTYGFPLEVTQELCAEAGIEVDVEGYEVALKEAQERSRAGQERDTVYGAVALRFDILVEEEDDGKPTPTKFLGYDTVATPAIIKGALAEPEEDDGITRIVIALDQTPFYSASGGQISDKGFIKGDGIEGKVTEVLKQDGLYIHEVEVVSLPVAIKDKPEDEAKKLLNDALFNKPVFAEVDRERRASIQRNHTATHLLHAALRQTLGTHVTQAGSYVGPDRLRFDFTHGNGLNQEELAKVERIVNEEALKNTVVTTYVDIPVAEAKQRGAMALFGEKYGDKVRMVEIGDFSRELCGGTHVRSTGEIGLFRIESESSAASGVRRIEAVTGLVAYQHALNLASELKEASAILKSQPGELVHAVERTLEQLKDERRKREKAEQMALKGGGDSGEKVDVKGVTLWTKNFGEIDPKIAASALDDAVAQDPKLVALGAVVNDGKATITCKVGSQAIGKGAHAGNLVREVSKIAGGGGGGRPDFATAGAKDLSKLDEALAAALSLLTSQVS